MSMTSNKARPSNQDSHQGSKFIAMPTFRLNGTEYFPIPLVPAEGIAPSLAH